MWPLSPTRGYGGRAGAPIPPQYQSVLAPLELLTAVATWTSTRCSEPRFWSRATTGPCRWRSGWRRSTCCAVGASPWGSASGRQHKSTPRRAPTSPREARAWTIRRCAANVLGRRPGQPRRRLLRDPADDHPPQASTGAASTPPVGPLEPGWPRPHRSPVRRLEPGGHARYHDQIAARRVERTTRCRSGTTDDASPRVRAVSLRCSRTVAPVLATITDLTRRCFVTTHLASRG